MPLSSNRRSNLTPVSVLLILIPVFIFYAVVLGSLLDMPLLDDYAILGFLNHFSQLHGLVPKALSVLATQFNEYKIMLGASIFAAQYEILGHVSFRALDMIGDVSVLAIGFILWKLFLPNLGDRSLRLGLFIPVSWLLFQLSYAETLNWAAPAIQNLYVLCFALASFLYLSGKSRISFPISIVCLVLSIAASGNGFIAAAIGFTLLLLERRVLRLATWTLATVCMLFLYSYHYNAHSSQGAQGKSVFQVMLHLKLTYVLSFLGSSAYILGSIRNFPELAGTVTLGCLFCIYFFYEGFRWKLLEDRAVACSVLFVFITAFGVAAIRSDLGLAQSISSRYRIYSDLLIIFAWFRLCERYFKHIAGSLFRDRVYMASCGTIILFSLAIDWRGAQNMRARNKTLIEGMALYEHPSPTDADEGPMFLRGEHSFVIGSGVNAASRASLSEASKLGIYIPPPY